MSKHNSFFSFNPKASPGSQWKEVAPFPGSGENIFAFANGNKGFVLFKMDDGRNILWQFNPASGAMGSWKSIGQVPNPGDVDPYYLFNIGNAAYVYFPISRNNFWMYIPKLD